MGVCSSAVLGEEDMERIDQKNCDAVEAFLRMASLQGDHLDAIHNILSIDNARKQFFEFLRTDYYTGAVEYYQVRCVVFMSVFFN